MGAKRPMYNENTSGARPQVFFRNIDCVESVQIDAYARTVGFHNASLVLISQASTPLSSR